MPNNDRIALATSPQEKSQSELSGRFELFLVGAIASVHLLLLRPWFLLARPYWHDEAWVALADRAPLSQIALATGTTPIGWTFLMSVLPGSGSQHQRLLPLAFSVGTVILAYLLARDVIGSHPHRTITATVTALMVAIAPAMLVRQDLKQYTADAFVALLVLWLVVRLGTAWSTRRLWTLVVVAVLSSLVSYASMFVSAAVMFSLVVVNAARGRRHRLAQSLAAAFATATTFGAVTWLAVVPHLSDGLREFWREFYLQWDGGIWEVLKTMYSRLDELTPLLGLRWAPLLGLLTALGLIAMARRGHPVAALAIPVLWLEMMVLGFVERYPFLDLRTSHFLLVVTISVAAIGIGFLFSRVSVRSSTLGAVFLLLTVLLVSWQSVSFLTDQTFPIDEVREQTRYVAEQFESGDTVLVNALSVYGFAYYWPDQPQFFPTDRFLTGFNVRFDRDDIFLANGRSRADIEQFFSAALRSASDEGSSGRIWLVRYYMIESGVETLEFCTGS